MPAAPYPTFDNFSLQDENYITSEIVYRTIPNRELESQKVSRRPGTKLISSEFAERSVSIRGSIIGTSPSNLQTLIDAIHTNITRKESVVMYTDSDRYGTATVRSVAIGDPHYSQDYVPMEMELVMNDPFFYGLQTSVSLSIPAGTTTYNSSITISGSVFAEPTFVYNSPAGGGVTTTSGIKVTYGPTAEYVTWSGTGLAQSSSVTFDYDSHRILEGTTEAALEGVFSRWEPGAQSFTVTFSGTANGGTLGISYPPRYL